MTSLRVVLSLLPGLSGRVRARESGFTLLEVPAASPTVGADLVER